MKNQEKIAVMPNLGDYYVPVKILIEQCVGLKLIPCPPTTKKTVENGSKHSPDTVCTPYKITCGNFIDALRQTKANVLLMPGVSCRLGLYDVLHKKTLEDLGYEFEMLVLFDFVANSGRLYRSLNEYEPSLTQEKYNEVLAIVAKIVTDMDELADYMRRHAAFEINRGDFEKNYRDYLKQSETVCGLASAEDLGKRYKDIFRSIKIDKPHNPVRIGLIGDLYSLMEPHGNCEIEKWLYKHGAEIWRGLDLTLMAKTMLSASGISDLISQSGGYADYYLGGVANTTIAFANKYAASGVDGLIHMKAASCSPEITAMSILQTISKDFGVPIVYLTFDTETSEAGLHTRLEAFLDML